VRSHGLAGGECGEAPKAAVTSQPTADAAVWLDAKGAAARALVSSATTPWEACARRLVDYDVGGRKCRLHQHTCNGRYVHHLRMGAEDEDPREGGV
jgi:hypothetical protein